MNQTEFIKRLAQEHDICTEISRKKNADYSTEGDAFLNFRGCEAIGVDPKIGIMVRMTDKLARVSNLLNKEAQVTDESVADTLRDLANYALILKLFIDNENQHAGYANGNVYLPRAAYTTTQPPQDYLEEDSG